MHAHQRPKLERYDDTLFLVLKTVNYVPHESVVLAREIVETGEVMIFVGEDFVVTVRHGEHGGLAEVRKRMDAGPQHLRRGPYAVMHAIADRRGPLPGSDQPDRIRHRQRPGGGVRARPHARRRTDLPAQTRSRRAAPMRRPAVGRVPADADREQRPDLQRSAALFARRRRPPIRGRGPDRRLRRHARLAGAGRAGPGRHAAEQRHAQDIGLGRHRRGADHDRRHLRHELRVHARAQVALGLPDGGRHHGSPPASSCTSPSERSSGSSTSSVRPGRNSAISPPCAHTRSRQRTLNVAARRADWDPARRLRRVARPVASLRRP